MIVSEYNFTDYYHKYITIEADELTEQLNDIVKITEKDCYVLCSSYCDEEGLIHFNVLSVGQSWERCTRGLKNKKMLGDFTIDEVYYKTMRVADEDVLKSREDARLDEIRDVYYPDVVYAGMIHDLSMYEYPMRITGIKGPFLVGALLEEPKDAIGVHEGEPVYALPYLNDGVRLFALFAGEHLDAEQKKVMNQLIQETNEIGIDFHGISLKN